MIKLEPYARFLQEQALGRLILSSVIGRIPMGASTLALVLFLQARTGSFADAGLVAGLYVLGLGVTAPMVGRLLDGWGPRPVLGATALAYPAALGAVAALVLTEAGTAWIGASAFLAGAALPPVTICMRSLYPRVLSDPRAIRTAYSLDSAVVETVFVFGPGLVALLAGLGAPIWALAVAALAGSAGTLMLRNAPAVRGWGVRDPATRRAILGPLHSARLRRLMVACVFYAGAFGLFEMGVTGFAAAHGSPAAAGVFLALAGLGSVAGALVFGSHEWSVPPARQFHWALGLMASGILLLVPLQGLYAFGLVSPLAAGPIGAVIASQAVLVSESAPRGMLAESFTWSTTGVLVGVSSGIAGGGALLEVTTPAVVLLGAVLSTLLALLWARLALGERAD